ncbi:MAG: lactonase family protein [Actinomycetota bacterium]
MGRGTWLVVGSLNREAPYFQGARGPGLSVMSFDESKLSAETVAETSSIDNPTFLTVDEPSGCIYANSEVFGWHEGVVSAYRYDAAGQRLDYLNKQPTLGSIAAYNSLSRDRRHLFVANYAMGSGGPDQAVAVFGVDAVGRLSPPVASVAHAGRGPHPERQERNHAHCVLQAPESQLVLVADLGLDRIVGYRLEDGGGLTRIGETPTAPGSGPRHLAFHPQERLVLVSNELDSTVSSFSWDDSGRLEHRATVAIVPDTFGGESHAADLHFSPDGAFAYASNRGHDSIAVLSVEAPSGALKLVEQAPSGGKTPRNLTLTPSGRHVLAANQNGDNITIFERNEGSGRLRDTGSRILIGTPVCVRVAAIG